MGYFNATYNDDLLPILRDYISNSGTGQSVINKALSYANRAQNNLWAKKPWCDLATDIDVALVNNSFTFPANFGRIVSIWADLSGLGVPDYWYYEGGIYEKGYKLRDSFTNANGHQWTISFHFTQTSSVKMIYQRLLEPFTGEGTEYLFFPLNLILLECQKINLREKGQLNELAAIKEAFDDEFKDYCNAHQWVNYDSTARINDRNGYQISTDSFSLDGSTIRNNSIRENSWLGRQ
jgi:hypothetical protein